MVKLLTFPKCTISVHKNNDTQGTNTSMYIDIYTHEVYDSQPDDMEETSLLSGISFTGSNAITFLLKRSGKCLICASRFYM